MRFLMVFLFAAAGLRAQTPSRAEEVLKKFTQQLDKLKRPAITPSVVEATAPKVCSIPLLVVRPNKVDPQMAIDPKSDPKSDTKFQIREVIPPAPVCESVRWK
jgi:hypothetical protein